jgi:hypothetical protein
MLSILAISFTGAAFWETYFPHRALQLTVAIQRQNINRGLLIPGQTFDLSPIIANTGNRTEIIPCISIAISPSYPPDNQYRDTSAGPYVLKAGEAITAPIKVSFDTMRSGVGNNKDFYVDVYVHVVALSPNNDIIAVDIPVSRVTFPQPIEENRYTENRSPGYNDNLIDIFSATRSRFGPTCQRGASAILTIRITEPERKHPRLPRSPSP